MTGGQHNEGGLTPQRSRASLTRDGRRARRRRSTTPRRNRPQGLPARRRDAPARRARRRCSANCRKSPASRRSSTSRPAPPRSAAAASAASSPTPTAASSSTRASARAAATVGVQSNCVSIVPLETEFGRKRAIDQSSCNKDFSCLKGFCPSFVTLEGGKVEEGRRGRARARPTSRSRRCRRSTHSYNTVITGVGGTGVVTVGAVLAMAAHLEGKGAGVMEMAGLAQKGGAVHIHCPDRREAIRHLGDPRRGRRGRRADRRRSRGGGGSARRSA